MVESQLAKIVAAIPISNDGKILAQPKNWCEKVNAMVTRGGKSTRDPPNPYHFVWKAKQRQEAEPTTTQEEKENKQKVETTPKDFVNTSYLSFPRRNRKQAVDEQFTRFVEMIEKIHVSVPLMDFLHVPSYAKYIKDIVNNKQPLPSTKVVKLTKECSAAILNRLPKKKRTLGALPSHAPLAPSNWSCLERLRV